MEMTNFLEYSERAQLRSWLMANHELHTIARNDAETAAQVYSEWTPRAEQVDVSVRASRK